jgi:LysR family glycine cleavage system transcriptional activator
LTLIRSPLGCTGFTSKWLAPRLYRFSIAHPEIDVSSSLNNANFTTDGVDAAIRYLAVDAPHGEVLEVQKLIDLTLAPVCSPAFVEEHGPFTSPEMLKRVPLIHDESLSSSAAVPTWAEWFAAAGVRDADVGRGLRFNNSEHALNATAEGAGVLLAFDALAYDDLRSGRLVMPFALTLPSGRCYAFVCPKKRRDSANVQAFRAWLRQEVALDRSRRSPCALGLPPSMKGAVEQLAPTWGSN